MAIKLLHIADIHLGVENYGRINPETGLHTALEEFCKTFDQAIDVAIDRGVDLVVLAGDIYKNRDPSPTHQREFARRIQRLIRADVPVFIAPGNHDVPMSPSRATSVDIFRTLELAGVTVARGIGKFVLETKSGAVQVLALPWVTRSLVLSAPQHKNKTIEELNSLMVQMAAEKLEALAGELDPAIPGIVVGHAHVSGSLPGAERQMSMGTDPMFDLGSFTGLPKVDYVALGHIHKHQVLARHPNLVVYSGSINRVDFGEEDEAKGFVLAEVEPGGADYQFVQVDARRFVTIDANAEGDDATQEVLKAVYRTGEKIRDAVVRVRIRTTRAAASRLDEDEIRGQLKEAFYLLPLQRELVDGQRERVTGRDFQGKTSLELLQIYFEGKDLASDRRETLLSYARELMQGAGDGSRESGLGGEISELETQGARLS